MKVDLHVHTSYSYDCNSKPKEVIRVAITKGINCLAICDHGEIKGAIEARQFASHHSLLIIPSIEIKSKEGDILGLNIQKIIPNGLSAKETIKKIKEAGGIAIIPHPFGWFCKFRGNLEKLIKEIDGIEVLNASIFGNGNKIAFNFAKKFNLPFTVGSDAHHLDIIGRAYLEIPGENLSIEEIFNQIKNRNVKIGGEEANFFEKLLDHTKRGLSKIQYVRGKKREI